MDVLRYGVNAEIIKYSGVAICYEKQERSWTISITIFIVQRQKVTNRLQAIGLSFHVA